jgi:hypothetical protein
LDVTSGAMISSDTLQITPEILNPIAEMDEFKERGGLLAPKRPAALLRVATIESIGSSTSH